jgi:hypothetical protein
MSNRKIGREPGQERFACSRAGSAKNSAGNVANSQPHDPRLIRAATPPSSFEASKRCPARTQRVGLGRSRRGKAPLGGPPKAAPGCGAKRSSPLYLWRSE